ncbi:MAG: hypothetical protein QXQ61_00765 [Candidatus Bathyarchaeia archaeon]
MTIASAILFYLIAIFNLTTFGSPTFIICSYAGTILLLIGALSKTGAFETKNLKHAAAIIILFASAILFTTAIVALFLDIKMVWRISRIIPIASPPSATAGGDIFDLPGPESLSGLGGLNLTLIRPYAWLTGPLIATSLILLAIAAVIEYIL